MVLVSVLMPMRNASKYVKDAIESVLQEERVDIELVVIDDHSKDSSKDIVMEIGDPRIRLLDSRERGVAATLNTGLEVVKGQFITRCDADDRFSEGRLPRQVDWLQKHQDYGAICGRFIAMSVSEKYCAELGMESHSRELTDELQKGYLQTSFCTYMVHTSLVKELGGFRRFFVTASDIDMQFRLSEMSRIWFSSEVFYHYRLHNASVTHSQANIQREFFERTAREFQKQRQACGIDDLQKNCPPKIPRKIFSMKGSPSKQMQRFYIGQAWTLFQKGSKPLALKTMLKACTMCPLNIMAWKNLFVLLLVKKNIETYH